MKGMVLARAGGVEQVPVDASQLERMRTDVGSTLARRRIKLLR